MKFSEFINEGRGEISDTTGANKSVSRKENKLKFFTIREWNEEEKNNSGYAWAIKQGKFKWDIVDNIKPDFKTSFPIEIMRVYSDDMKTVSINVKNALRDIAAGRWEPDKYVDDDLIAKYK